MGAGEEEKDAISTASHPKEKKREKVGKERKEKKEAQSRRLGGGVPKQKKKEIRILNRGTEG